MERSQAMRYQGTPDVPPAQLGTHPLEPQPTSARIECDSQFVEALRSRASTAAERLVAAYGDRAYRFAIGITGSGPDAEEAVQGYCVIDLGNLRDGGLIQQAGGPLAGRDLLERGE